MSFIQKLAERYQQEIQAGPVDDILTDITRKHGDNGVYVRFSNRKQLDKNLDNLKLGPAGITVYPLSQAETHARNFKYAHIIKLDSEEVLELQSLTSDRIAMQYVYEVQDALTSIGYEAFKYATKPVFRKLSIDTSKPYKLFLACLRYGLNGELLDPKTQAKALLGAGYKAVVEDAIGRGSLEEHGASSCVVILDQTKVKVLEVVDLKKAQPKVADLDDDEKAVLERYQPKLGPETPFRKEMDRDEFKKNLPSMSDDDVAWHLSNSSNALDLQEAAFSRMGLREVNFLLLMNEKLSKEERSDIASWILDKAGVSFVGGPNLKMFIRALSKKGLLKPELSKEASRDELQDDIFYGRITDPDELRKLDVKEWGYQLAHNPHTPYDVLKKIVKQTGDIKWTGANPTYGGVPGETTRYLFCDAMNNPNYPTKELIATFRKYQKKYSHPEALAGMLTTLMDRDDLPAPILEEILVLREHSKYSRFDLAATLSPEQVTRQWQKLLKAHKEELAKDKTARTDAEHSLRKYVEHKSVTPEILHQILNWRKVDDHWSVEEARSLAYKKLRSMKALADDEVVKQVKKNLKFDGPEDLLAHFGEHAWRGEGSNKLTFKRVSAAELRKLEQEMLSQAAHEEFTFKVVDAFKVDRPIHKDYAKTAKKLGNVKAGIYHGTSLANAAGILATGINVQAKERTGSMFGNGFYLAGVSSKAVQYASDDFSHAGVGVVFKLDAALGKTADWKYGRPEDDNLRYGRGPEDAETKKKIAAYCKKHGIDREDLTTLWHIDHDSVTARAGMALLFDEYVVKSGQQINIDTVILVSKEPKEKKNG